MSELTISGVKQCSKCKEWKLLSQYNKYSRGRQGRQAYCKLCQLDWYQKVKREVVEAYGGECFCCGEKELSFLAIDHVNNNGAEDRRRRGVGGGYNFYLMLRKEGYPSGYQTSCANCNISKHSNGGVCWHQLQR